MHFFLNEIVNFFTYIDFSGYFA